MGGGVARAWGFVGVPAACASVGLMLALLFIFGVGCWRLGFPSAYAAAGLMLALYFIFIDPCAGQHLLLLLRQKK
jgi:hypothetical protein